MRRAFRVEVDDVALVVTRGGRIIVATSEQELAQVPTSWVPFDLDADQITVTQWLAEQKPKLPPRTPPLEIGGTPRRIPRGHLNSIDQACRNGYPRESCGIILGRDVPGEPLIARNVHIYNTSPTPRAAYRFAHEVQLDLYREMDEQGWDPLVIWHSHTNGREHTHPSDTDLDLATEPNAIYMILAYDTKRDNEPNIGWWQIRDGVAREVMVELVD